MIMILIVTHTSSDTSVDTATDIYTDNHTDSDTGTDTDTDSYSDIETGTDVCFTKFSKYADVHTQNGDRILFCHTSSAVHLHGPRPHQ